MEAISSNGTRKLLWFEISTMLIAATAVSFIIIPGKLSFLIDKQGSRGYGTSSNLSGAAAGGSV